MLTYTRYPECATVPLASNPLRVIALIDNDAFYASAERVRLGLSDGTCASAARAIVWLKADASLTSTRHTPRCSAVASFSESLVLSRSYADLNIVSQIAVSYKAREYGIGRMDTVRLLLTRAGCSHLFAE